MSAKLFMGIIIGAGAALTIGYLMTAEGGEIIKKIKESRGGILDFVSDSLNKGKDLIKDVTAEAAGNEKNVKEEVAGATQA